ncbi:uncharacterized protein SPSK_01382 [Sporothrix schenckii 1099-18]|uniref:Uncharacterized protein n=1 Tax=Sporothrix schenckii 1099-18 TaxID=1397361 RepID=A0A0F2MH08_SPOSC|nr:uncharacterized protein SPSK_01382 [Sporothrix schenckii 1099-18]KJR87431.1 hypothetical protein SPSK_01382 [Sporothrix schenckii 1099-18]
MRLMDFLLGTTALAGAAHAADLLFYQGMTFAEYRQALALNYTVHVASKAEWYAMTTADFAQYKAIVVPDADCGSLDQIQFLSDTKAAWGPAVVGNVIVMGTDTTYHASTRPGAVALMNDGIRFAASGGTEDQTTHRPHPATGLYFSLSCYYDDQPFSTVDALTPLGTFVAQGRLSCFDEARIVATPQTSDRRAAANPEAANSNSAPQLQLISDGNLSNWSCSAHALIPRYPAGGANGFVPLAVLEDAAAAPGAVGIHSFAGGVRGVPYIVARGVTPLGCGDGVVSRGSGEQCDEGTAQNEMCGQAGRVGVGVGVPVGPSQCADRDDHHDHDHDHHDGRFNSHHDHDAAVFLTKRERVHSAVYGIVDVLVYVLVYVLCTVIERAVRQLELGSSSIVVSFSVDGSYVVDTTGVLVAFLRSLQHVVKCLLLVAFVVVDPVNIILVVAVFVVSFRKQLPLLSRVVLQPDADLVNDVAVQHFDVPFHLQFCSVQLVSVLCRVLGYTFFVQLQFSVFNSSTSSTGPVSSSYSSTVYNSTTSSSRLPLSSSYSSAVYNASTSSAPVSPSRSSASYTSSTGPASSRYSSAVYNSSASLTSHFTYSSHSSYSSAIYNSSTSSAGVVSSSYSSAVYNTSTSSSAPTVSSSYSSAVYNSSTSISSVVPTSSSYSSVITNTSTSLASPTTSSYSSAVYNSSSSSVHVPSSSYSSGYNTSTSSVSPVSSSSISSFTSTSVASSSISNSYNTSTYSSPHSSTSSSSSVAPSSSFSSVYNSSTYSVSPVSSTSASSYSLNSTSLSTLSSSSSFPSSSSLNNSSSSVPYSSNIYSSSALPSSSLNSSTTRSSLSTRSSISSVTSVSSTASSNLSTTYSNSATTAPPSSLSSREPSSSPITSSSSTTTDRCGQYIGVEIVVIIDIVEICPRGSTYTITSTTTIETVTKSICNTTASSVSTINCYGCQPSNSTRPGKPGVPGAPGVPNVPDVPGYQNPPSVETTLTTTSTSSMTRVLNTAAVATDGVRRTSPKHPEGYMVRVLGTYFGRSVNQNGERTSNTAQEEEEAEENAGTEGHSHENTRPAVSVTPVLPTHHTTVTRASQHLETLPASIAIQKREGSGDGGNGGRDPGDALRDTASETPGALRVGFEDDAKRALGTTAERSEKVSDLDSALSAAASPVVPVVPAVPAVPAAPALPNKKRSAEPNVDNQETLVADGKGENPANLPRPPSSLPASFANFELTSAAHSSGTSRSRGSFIGATSKAALRAAALVCVAAVAVI